jgi:cytochrome c-type biogenesis protein CcmH
MAAASGGRVTGVVTLAPEVAAKAKPTDTVFIFARAAEGPRMPLAILKRQVSDLPFKFSLDDSQAMTPAMKLSNFPEVVVGARVSQSGTAAPQSGDLEGLSGTVKVGAKDVAIVIDKVLP